MLATQSLGASADAAAAARQSVQAVCASPDLQDAAFAAQLPVLFAKPQLAQADTTLPAYTCRCM